LDLPHIGDCSLSEITPELLVSLYGRLRERGGRRTKSCPEGRPLGTRSVLSAHVMLSMVLSDAVEAGALPNNPVERIPKRQRPKHRNRRQSGKHWDAQQAARFIGAVANDRRFALWSVLLDSGMRRGEVCALRWPHLDLNADTATVAANRVHAGPGQVVEGTTKTDRVRTIELDQRTVAALTAWHKRLAREKLAVGESWAGDLETGYVVVDETGHPIRPDSLNYAFEKACRAARVPVLSPHGLRHTAATLALARGVPPHVVQERLGHSDISITLGLYNHVIPGQQRSAAQAIGDAIYGTGS
jgi:integrase